MNSALSFEPMVNEPNPQISEGFERERPRWRNFIRRHVGDDRDAEDIL